MSKQTGRRIPPGVRKAGTDFRNATQKMVDDPESGITSVSISAGGQTVQIAQRKDEPAMPDPNTDAAMIEGVLVASVNIKKGAVELKIVAPVGAAQDALDLLVQYGTNDSPCLLTLSRLQAAFGSSPREEG